VGSSDLVVTKTGPGGAVPGDRITYTITVDNLGPSDASGVVVTDTLPFEVTMSRLIPSPARRWAGS
jgi:uncharacterized repeat protein (TIGR01451 family)